MQVEARWRCHVQPFLCLRCGRSFPLSHAFLHMHEMWAELTFWPLSVQVEARCHVQPFLCVECGRSFTYRHNLEKHRACHVKPEKRTDCYQRKVKAAIDAGKPHFMCDTCGKVGCTGRHATSHHITSDHITSDQITSHHIRSHQIRLKNWLVPNAMHGVLSQETASSQSTALPSCCFTVCSVFVFT